MRILRSSNFGTPPHGNGCQFCLAPVVVSRTLSIMPKQTESQTLAISLAQGTASTHIHHTSTKIIPSSSIISNHLQIFQRFRPFPSFSPLKPPSCQLLLSFPRHPVAPRGGQRRCPVVAMESAQLRQLRERESALRAELMVSWQRRNHLGSFGMIIILH